MKKELHEYLDGERPFEDLPPDLQAEARSWESRIDDFRDRTDRSAPAWIRPKVLREIEEEEAAPSGWQQWVQWALLPLAGAAVALAIWLQPWQQIGSPLPGGQTTATAERADGATHFRLEAPDADRVEVAGSFTDWRPELQLEDADGDGVWTGSAPLEAGVHQYMFVVDGEQWVTDPNADRYVADGFGNRNAVVAVTP